MSDEVEPIVEVDAMDIEVSEPSPETESAPEPAEEPTNTELKETITDEDATSSEKKEASKELKRRFKIKVDGEEVEEEFDPTDDQKIVELLQKTRGADKKFQEASTIKKEVHGFVDLMKTDPAKALKILGINPDQFAEGRVAERLKQLEMSPEQLRLSELELKLQEIESQKETAEKELENQRHEREKEKYRVQFDKEIGEALKEKDLPHDPFIVGSVARILNSAREKDTDVKIKDVLPLAEKSLVQNLNRLFSKLEPSRIKQFIGEEAESKLRSDRRAQAKKLNATTNSDSIKSVSGSSDKKTKPQMSMDDFFRV